MFTIRCVSAPHLFAGSFHLAFSAHECNCQVIWCIENLAHVVWGVLYHACESLHMVGVLGTDKSARETMLTCLLMNHKKLCIALLLL